jgi:LacI family transcriptional regulator
MAAQSMAWQRKEVIGLVTIESRGPETDIEQEGLLFIEEVLRGVELALSQVEWSVLIWVLRDSDRPGAYRGMQKISAKVDGMLIAEGIVGSEQLAMLAARVPIVLVAGSPDEPYADVVDADNRVGTVALTRYLVQEHGKTRLFYIAGPPQAPDARERRRVFEEALAEHPGATHQGKLRLPPARLSSSAPRLVE